MFGKFMSIHHDKVSRDEISSPDYLFRDAVKVENESEGRS